MTKPTIIINNYYIIDIKIIILFGIGMVLAYATTQRNKMV
jgi:hypothetical protein